jgi:hypothetical protein
MKSTERASSKTFRTPEAKRADSIDRDESQFNIVIELDEFEMSQVAGGRKAGGDPL